jgi:uncharacterized protein (TIGR04255 family)
VEKVPKRLAKAPILEALFELRFSSGNPAAADILQSSIFPTFRARLPSLSRTPVGAIPQALISQNPELKYQPRLIMQGNPLAIFVGDNAIALSCRRPYLGWSKFQPVILELVDCVKKSGLKIEAERYSLRYMNLFEGENHFASTRFSATLGRYDLKSANTYTRTEFVEEGHTIIIELGSHTLAKGPEGPSLNGMLCTLDTINLEPKGFWDSPAPMIDKTHDVEKSTFFGILTEEAITKMGPEY